MQYIKKLILALVLAAVLYGSSLQGQEGKKPAMLTPAIAWPDSNAVKVEIDDNAAAIKLLQAKQVYLRSTLKTMRGAAKKP